MAATLEIVVRAQDQASTVINGVAASGQKLTGTLNQQSTATQSLGSRFSTTGRQMLGLASGAVLVSKGFGFISDSLGAAEESQQAMARLEGTLDSMGRSIPAEALADAASKMQLLSGMSDEEIESGQRLLATFANISDELLGRLTPVLADFAAQFTNGNLEGAATMLGKALDDPVRGMTALRRVGVTVTSEQAEMVKQFMAAGEAAQAQGVILDALRPQIEGAAEDQATASSKLSAAFDEVKESIGNMLLPIVGPLADALSGMFNGFASLPTPIKLVVSGIVALTGAAAALWLVLGPTRFAAVVSGFTSIASSAVTAITNFVATTMATQALTVEFGLAGVAGAGMWTSILGPVAAALAAGLAIGHMLDKIFGISEGLSKLIVPDDPRNTGEGITENQDSYASVFALYKSGAIDAQTLTARVDELNKKFDQNVQAAALINLALTDTKLAARGAGKQVRALAMTDKQVSDWGEQVKTSSTQSMMSLGGVKLATKQTAKEFLRSSHMMAKVAQQDARAMQQLAKQDWVNDDYKTWLTSQGPHMVANFEKLNHKQQVAAIRDWDKTTGSVEDHNRSVDDVVAGYGKMSTTPIDKVRGAVNALGGALRSLGGTYNANVNLNVNAGANGSQDVNIGSFSWVSHFNGFAHGGVVPFGQMAWVGEHGRELAWLPGGTQVWPHGQTPTVTSSSGSLSITVSPDRRRFSRSMDHDFAYSGQ